MEISFDNEHIQDIAIFGEKPDLEKLQIDMLRVKSWPQQKFNKLKRLENWHAPKLLMPFLYLCIRFDIYEELDLTNSTDRLNELMGNSVGVQKIVEMLI